MALTRPNTTATAEETRPAAEEQVEMTEEGVQATVEAEHQPVEETNEAQDAPRQEVAEAQSKAVTQSRPTGSFEAEMEEDGFGGLTLGGLSFDQIKLPGEGQFLMGDEEVELGKEFDCVIQQTRARYVIRQSDERDADMFYSYDPKGRTNTEGEDQTEKLEEWAEDGYEKPVVRKYIEAMAVLVNRDDDYDGHMVMLSISPSSVQKFSGHVMQAKMMKGKKLSQIVTKCYVAKKRGSGSESYFPWGFRNGGDAPELF